MRNLFLVLALALCAAPAFAADRVTRSGDSPPVSLDIRYHEAAERLIGAALASDHAYTRMSELCDGIGHRLSGSAALDRAIAWASGAMREDGLDRVRLQPVMVPVWVRGEEHAEIIEPGPHRLTMLGLGRSVGTPPGGITADVVVVNSFTALDSLPEDQVRGRIVLYDVPFTNYGETVAYRGRGANRAARRGAVAALVRSVGPVSLRTPHTGSMSDYVDSLPKIPAAAITIEDASRIHRLTARGQRVRVRLEMDAHTRPDTLSHNVIGEIRGREKPNEIVVIGGHLDSWDVGAGAHDDGGGCVISMEALRLMKSLGLRPRRTVRCVLWTNEENGVRGARAYADSAHGEITRHVAVIETDGGVERPIGFGVRVMRTDRDTTTDSVRTSLAVGRVREIGRLLAGIGAQGVTADGGGADIDPLMKKGVTGLAHRTTMEHYFDWHHTPADMLDKVDPIELRKNVAAVAVMVYVLADMQEPLAGFAPAPASAANGASSTKGASAGR